MSKALVAMLLAMSSSRRAKRQNVARPRERREDDSPGLEGLAPRARLTVAIISLIVCAVVASAATAGPPARSYIRSAGPAGAERTLVVVNGGPGVDSQFTFRGFKSLASASWRVVAYDQRGVGRTPMPQSGNTANLDYSLDAFVADLEALRVRLDVETIDLIGHSFGALVAAAYTATHPDRVRSLTLISGLPVSVKAQYEGDARFEQRLALLQRRGLVPRIVPELCARRHRALLPVYLGDPARAGVIATKLGTSRCDDSVDALVNASILSDPRRKALARALGRYRGPALVAIGARDPFGTAWADQAAAPLSGANVTTRILPGVGHFPWLESPTFLPLLRAFVNRA